MHFMSKPKEELFDENDEYMACNGFVRKIL